MSQQFDFTFEHDWRTAPLAFWVHVPTGEATSDYLPPAPKVVLHKGFRVLHVEIDNVDLQFSSLAQLNHFIEVIEAIPRPTSLQLSRKRASTVGPNGHWLSRLPAKLKAPKAKEKLVISLKSVRDQLLPLGDSWHSYSGLI